MHPILCSVNPEGCDYLCKMGLANSCVITISGSRLMGVQIALGQPHTYYTFGLTTESSFNNTLRIIHKAQGWQKGQSKKQMEKNYDAH